MGITVASTTMHAYIKCVSYDVFRDDSRRKSILANSLELVHMPFYGAGTPTHRQSGRHSSPIALQIAAETAQFWRTRLVHFGNPIIQFATAPLTNQAKKLLRQPTRTGEFGAPLVQLL